MSDIRLDEEFERYVIGFTENHFIPSDTFSPTPSDHAIGFNTFASDFAEKSNRGELKIFQDHSVHLDRQKRHSVSKIHTNILDLMSELSERRKVGTPILSKSAMELYRPDSRSSDISDVSWKSSSSLPLIQVQQLPPLSRSNRSLSALSYDVNGLPFIGIHQKDTAKVKKKRVREKHNTKQRNKETVLTKKEVPAGASRFESVVREAMKRNTEKNINKEDGTESENKTINKNETDELDSRNVRFKIDNDTFEEKEISKKTEMTPEEKSNKWKTIYEKLKNAMDVVKERGDSFNAYKGRYYSNDAKARKMSYCQSSYHERAERERMQNIRRRHSSQTNVGPVDFSKLRRQLTQGRSKTMCN